MKIVHVIESQDNEYGGPSASVPYLIEACRRSLIDSVVISADGPSANNFLINSFGINWCKCDSLGPRKIKYSKNIVKKISSEDGNIIHLHNLWNYVSYSALVAKKRINVPLIVSPRSGLYLNSLKNRAFAKKISSFLFHDKLLSSAACLHVTSEDEFNNVRAYGYKGPVAIIPNVFFGGKIKNRIEKNKKFNILYMSRVHPRKNIEKTISGFREFVKKFNVNDANLILAGFSDDDYSCSIKKSVSDLIADDICSVNGFVGGDEKYRLLSGADVFVLLSEFENFGMSIAEALSIGIPVICSKGCPWPDIGENHAGAQIDVDESAFSEALYYEYCKWMSGDNVHDSAINYINKKFDTEKISKMYVDMYKWVTCGGEVPDFVRM